MDSKTQAIIDWCLNALHRTLEQSEKTAEIAQYRQNIALFSAVTTHLPETFELAVMTNHSPRAGKGKKRRKFGDNVREQFLARLAKNAKTSLKLEEMGLKPEEIALLAQKQRLTIGDTEQLYDLTIDHIRDISLGGSNAHENLCVLPHHVNSLKADFIRIQRIAIPSSPSFVSFRPANGDKIPYVKGGFRGMSNDRTILKQRTLKFLGLD